MEATNAKSGEGSCVVKSEENLVNQENFLPLTYLQSID